MQVKEFFKFIRERHNIHIKKERGDKRPWTKDPILQSYRFCNVYRELDTVTIWIRENWRDPFKNDPNVWFVMTVARVVNWPDSLYELSAAITDSRDSGNVGWNPKTFVRELDARKTRGEKVWTGAYMIHADRHATGSKAAYYAAEVLTPIWEARKDGQVAFETSLSTAHTWLMQFRDMGSFMAGQVVCDAKYTPALKDAKDWWTWAAPGPGSLRGMSRIEFGDLGTKYSAVEWREALRELQTKVDPLIAKANMPRLHAQDLQNCLCEFDKYQRVLHGEGRPRSLYPGKGE